MISNKQIFSIISVLALILSSGCKSGRQENAPDLDFLVNEGHKFAARYNSIKRSNNQMRIYDFLLDVKSREQRLREEVGNDYADVFISAFNDSAHVITTD